MFVYKLGDTVKMYPALPETFTDLAEVRKFLYAQREVINDLLKAPKHGKFGNSESYLEIDINGLLNSGSSSEGGQLGDIESKTIATAAIDLTSEQHFVALTGEGNVADDLTAITKTGGGDLDAGHLVVLKGKAGLAYDITINDNDDLRIQTVFTINSEYDSITLVCVGSGVFIEIARSSNA